MNVFSVYQERLQWKNSLQLYCIRAQTQPRVATRTEVQIIDPMFGQ